MRVELDISPATLRAMAELVADLVAEKLAHGNDTNGNGSSMLLSESAAADRLGMPKHSLRDRRLTGDGPVHHREYGTNRVWYRPEDLESWVGGLERVESRNGP